MTVRIEPWGAGDEDLLARLVGDPVMMEHLGGPESAAKIAERQERYAKPGSGAQKVIADGEGVGWVGCWEAVWRGADIHELGWSVVPEAQGRGVAVAATRLLLVQPRAKRVLHAFPGVANAASNAVCGRLGFTLVEEFLGEFPPGNPMRCNDWMLGAPAVRLELFADRHVDALEATLDDDDIKRFTRLPVPVPPGFARTWLERYEAGRADGGRREAFAAVDAAGTLLGLGLVPQIDRDAGEAELGYVVAPAARGRGAATEILRLLTRWALEEQKLLRVQLLIDVDNPASEKVAARAGYTREGVLRSLHLKSGIRVDTAIWSKLPTD